MAQQFYAEGDLGNLLRKELADTGMTQRQWAKKAGVSDAYVSDFLQERRRPGPAILQALGFDPGPFYRRIR